MYNLAGRVVGLLTCFLLLIGVSACAVTAPVQEMSNARQSIQAAKEAGAEIHAPRLLTEAQQLLEQASQYIDNGEYFLARSSALEAKQQAIKARQQALLKNRNE